ncbi:transcription factor iws1 [Coprinopsis marcescibilis]|uniref:Transcription factor iws1 n=1 Tax=Coprinopsis marcescibilis TaxID=230819 RepID=A0A5C3KDT3_COPMA|nr:transcription factor iws1 [Coprinopsis marcescibilis]
MDDRNEVLQREIFGGSESELSSDEDDVAHKAPPPQQNRRPSKPRDSYQQDSSGGDSEDDYVQERPSGAKPKKKRPSRKDGDEQGKQPALRKRKRKPASAGADNQGDEAESMSKSKRSGRRGKKKDEEILDAFADAEVARLREAMNNAAEEDVKANSDKQPATAKLKLLSEAMETLRKQSLAQSMIDNNLLDAVRRWLEPLPDKSLPTLTIQRELFGAIRKMEFIDSAVLKESGLGRIVLFYTKCKRVTPDIARIADELVSVWSRPIIKLSASYRDRIIPTAASDQADGRTGERLNQILARAKVNEKGRVRKNAVMIPQPELGNYTVAPSATASLSRINTSVDEDIARRRRNAERLRQFTRKAGKS